MAGADDADDAKDDGNESTRHEASDRTAAVRALRAKVAQLQRELDALAAAFDRWWSAPPGEGGSGDLREGVRLHQEIATRMGRLEAVRAALTSATEELETPC